MIEIYESNVGSFRRQLGLRGSDDMIATLEKGDLIDRPTTAGQPTTVYQKLLMGGPVYWVGPFLVPEAQKDDYTIHVPIRKMNPANSDYDPDIQKFGNWVVGQIAKLSKKKLKQLQVQLQVQDKRGTITINKDGKTWGSDYGTMFYPHVSEKPNRCSIPGGVCVPDDQVWYRNYLKGKDPIAKFNHPTRKRSGGGAEKWGVFVSFDEASKDYPEQSMTVTFKKVDPGLWGKLWDWIVEIATKIIKTVVDLIKSILDAVLKAACGAAAPIIKQLEIAAQKKTSLSLSNAAEVSAKTGISIDAMDRIIAGGSSAAIVGLGESLVKGLCGADTAGAKPAVEEEPVISPLMVAGGVGAAGVLLYLLMA